MLVLVLVVAGVVVVGSEGKRGEPDAKGLEITEGQSDAVDADSTIVPHVRSHGESAGDDDGDGSSEAAHAAEKSQAGGAMVGVRETGGTEADNTKTSAEGSKEMSTRLATSTSLSSTYIK